MTRRKTKASPQPTTAAERPTALRAAHEPSAAEASRKYHERGDHFAPRKTIGMAHEVVSEVLANSKSPAAERLRSAGKSIESLCEKCDAVLADIGGDQAIDSTSRFMESVRTRRQVVERMLAATNEAGRFATEFLASTDKAMREAWIKAGPETPVTPAETRAHVARLDGQPARVEFIEQAIEAGDGGVVHAVLSAPHYMLGISRAQLEQLVEKAHQAFVPDALRERDALREGLAALTKQAEAALGAYTVSAADAAHFDRAESSMKAAKDRAASLSGAGHD